ncbi:MAG: 2-oxo acid dehydrogenase subunit E2 [Cryomorphaceae bacterium]|jgi:pyruvate dehydrogenase E2 component (dihydrolipoamide acetyltransferase)|nr:2-oxo acid dehydrogenase subunit E2 [Cryomorphaceae bacterium]MBT3684576.1 2-oxo acid dehydrogenase subunit E2 [Cryomorphaceae bacterium]MBT4813208.1 2-oxo acid dehydrogenase subunit E2 [Cryomorphaceae bacterium]MBT5416763.1 2-oxo acid dehydrogenase subunit E2 [Cryomorphaceae bacterium]MBT6729973.1 2-oxo acid dehydrogenase subunit E2 [Cryomorphaceae bacterium]
MAEVINMPRLSDTMEEGTLAKWFKKVGDTVKEGEILAEIETDKATMEFESFYDGVLLHIGIDEGSTAPVDSIIAIIGSKGEDISEIVNNDTPIVKEEPAPIVKEEPAPIVKEEPAPIVKEEPAPVAKEQLKPVSIINISNDRILISPLAKKLADEKGIDISAITGSGDNGRIIKRDIDSFKTSNYSQFSQPRPHLTESSYETQNSTMRKAIAKRLADSKFSAPHYYLNIELEMDNIISFRKQFIQTQNIKISFNDIIAKAVSLSLAKHPKVNSRWYDDKIIFNEHVHLGVAVAVDDGLIVPVVKFSNSKDLPQINTEIKDFAERAKNKKLSPSEIEGSTFTISNLGMFGIESFTSIINQPNSAILSIGAIVQKPIVKNNEVVVGNTMKLTLACDHRTVDGATGSLFLKTLKEYIENPVSILI